MLASGEGAGTDAVLPVRGAFVRAVKVEPCRRACQFIQLITRATFSNQAALFTRVTRAEAGT